MIGKTDYITVNMRSLYYIRFLWDFHILPMSLNRSRSAMRYPSSFLYEVLVRRGSPVIHEVLSQLAEIRLPHLKPSHTQMMLQHRTHGDNAKLQRPVPFVDTLPEGLTWSKAAS